MRLFYVPGVHEGAAQDQTTQFWANQNSPLFLWLKKHNVAATPGTVPPFADGGVGRAYFLGQNVVKFTSNRVEANVAKLAAGRQDLPTPIIDVLYLGNNFYAILQHFVNVNVSEKIKSAADYLMAGIDDYPEMTGFPENKLGQEKFCSGALQRNRGPMDLLPYMLLLIDVLNKLYKETGFMHNDAGATNVGMLGNRVVFHDLGPNQTKDFNQLAALSQMQKNRKTLGLPRFQSI